MKVTSNFKEAKSNYIGNREPVVRKQTSRNPVARVASARKRNPAKARATLMLA